MATSGSYNYGDSVTAANVIAVALRRLGVYDPEETINSTEETQALQILNLLVKEWTNEGFAPYTVETAYLFLSTRTFSIFNPQSTRAVYNTANTTTYLLFNYNITTLASSVAAAAGSVTVTDDQLIANADHILIKQDDNLIYATTVNGAPAANVVTLGSNTVGASAAGKKVYTTALVNRYQGPISSILSARVLYTNQAEADYASAYEGEKTSSIEIVGDEEFHELSLRNQNGTPLKLYHKKLHDSSDIHIWPQGPLEDLDVIELVIAKPIQDLDATSNTFAIPPNGLNALSWCLAAEIAAEYGLSEAEQKRLWTIAETKKMNFFDSEVENASVIFEKSEG
jgi:hypothetical protein